MARLIPNIVEFVPEAARPRLGIVSVYQCQGSDYPDNRDDKGIKACLLNIRHHSLTTASGTSSSRIMTYSSYGQQRGGGATRPRQGMVAPYDRILFFADLSSRSGSCFAMILTTSNDSRYILQHGRSSVGVGDVFVVVEPHAVSTSLSLGLPLVTTDFPLLPLTWREDDITPVPMRLPHMNETLYFAMHGHEVNFSGVTIITRNVSCKGTLCDRQGSSLVQGRACNCGCLHVTRENSVVVECRVRFRVPTSFDSTGFAGVDGVRSWRLTKLFITAPNAPDIIDFENNRSTLVRLRAAVSAMSDSVNRNGGWTIVGWHRQGTVTDGSSNDQMDQVANLEQKLHLSFLHPTEGTDVNNEDFQALRYDPLAGDTEEDE